MIKARDYLWIILFLLFITLPFLFCKQNNSSTKIIFWQYWNGVERDALVDLVNKFNSENHGFQVDLLTISMPRKKFLMAAAGEVPPDLVHLDGDMVVDFARRSALAELDFSNTYYDEFLPVYIQMLKINGHQYAMPFMPSVEALHINRTLLKQYSLASPNSLVDLVRIFDTVGALQQGQSKSITNFEHIAYLPTWPPWSGIFLPVLFGGAWGERNADGDWVPTPLTAANLRAWTWVYNNFASKIPPDKLASFTEGFHSYQSPDNPFYSSKIAIEHNGVWEKNLAKVFAPQLDIEVKAFPSEIPMASYVAVDALAIPEKSKHIQEAKYFMQWLLRADNLEYMALKQKKFSPRKQYSADFIQKHENPYIKIFIDLASSPNAKFFPQLAYVSRYKRDIKNAYTQMIKGELSPEAALSSLQERYNK